MDIDGHIALSLTMLLSQKSLPSVGAHFHDRAGIGLLSFWTVKGANTHCMHQDAQFSDELTDLQDQQSLTLC